MKTNLLKFYRKHPVFFAILYGRQMDARKYARTITKAERFFKDHADACWGWDIDRDAYDACVIAAHMLKECKENQYEID